MSKKRPRSEDESSANGHEDHATTRKRPRTNHAHKAKSQKANSDSLTAIKKRARAIERLLVRDNLKIPADKQNELERELAAHKQRIAEAQAKKERSKMIKKYHMVRFFERKKAMRFVKQLEKKLAQTTDPDEVSQLKADLHIAQVDIDYARYFPFMEPYVSLYAGSVAEGKDDKNTAAKYLRTPRPPMWAVIEKTREEGVAALERLQNRPAQKGSSSDASQQSPKHTAHTKQQPSSKKEAKKGVSPRNLRKAAKSKPVRVEQKNAKADDDDGSSDGDSDGGGFFEED
ncbi:hypothetical protein VTK56DRAFT_5713 [Thermocarpiscus australiensis]